MGHPTCSTALQTPESDRSKIWLPSHAQDIAHDAVVRTSRVLESPCFIERSTQHLDVHIDDDLPLN